MDYDRAVAAVRTALGEGAFAGAWEAGGRMSVAQAVAYALERDEGEAAAALPESPPPPSLPLPDGLTAREAEVLALLAGGRSNREIAERLVVSAGTVEHHVAGIYRKIDVHSRAEATAYAIRHGLASLT